MEDAPNMAGGHTYSTTLTQFIWGSNFPGYSAFLIKLWPPFSCWSVSFSFSLVEFLFLLWVLLFSLKVCSNLFCCKTWTDMNLSSDSILLQAGTHSTYDSNFLPSLDFCNMTSSLTIQFPFGISQVFPELHLQQSSYAVRLFISVLQAFPPALRIPKCPTVNFNCPLAIYLSSCSNCSNLKASS